MTGSQGRQDVKMVSRVTATFAVQLCVKPEGSTTCQAVETRTVHVVRSRRGRGAAATCCCGRTEASVAYLITVGFPLCCWEKTSGCCR